MATLTLPNTWFTPKTAATPRRTFSDRIWALIGRVAAFSPDARSAEAFARLNKLSDAELAARHLRREDLVFHCFGARSYQ